MKLYEVAKKFQAHDFLGSYQEKLLLVLLILNFIRLCGFESNYCERSMVFFAFHKVSSGVLVQRGKCGSIYCYSRYVVFQKFP